MKSKYLKSLGGIIVLLVITFIIHLIIKCVISLVLMKDEITFSGAMVIALMSFPIIFYSILGSVFLLLFGKISKFNKLIVKCLTMLMIASFIVSFPISFYVDYKLKSDGYFVCDKISWRSPTTYVKDLMLCN
ncbi:membrane protein [Xenorhabdus beddingii]|uniref:Membrane protein n=1 Tax=Xenorhabdus beddingii TaxID=40578 RepID=A0A1Y2SJI3_9GAMM|nr:DUF1240 domain-containing protein [Xenorhabdus beddingii]OTA18920.1 membrane protein [Xenorhabdus beddingii]